MRAAPSRPVRPGSQTGLTLTEVTVVMVLASLVMVGLVGFYVASQDSWMASSAKAITQRDATSLIEAISERAHGAIVADASLDSTQLDLHYADPGASYSFWWNVADGGDSLIHEGPSGGGGLIDRGASVPSRCRRFKCVASDSLIRIEVALESAHGELVEVSTRVALVNRGSS